MDIAAGHTAPINPSRHHFGKNVHRATIMRPNVFDDIEVWAAGSLAAKSPIGVFHDGNNYMGTLGSFSPFFTFPGSGRLDAMLSEFFRSGRGSPDASASITSRNN